MALGWLLCIGPMVALADSEDLLDQRLDAAERLNASSHWRSGRAVLESIEPDLARASPEQRNAYDLSLARNLALSGASAAGLELIDQVLDRNPRIEIRLRALWLATNLAMSERSHHRAFNYAQEGLALIPRVDDPATRAGILGVAGLLYAEAGEFEQGIEMIQRGVDAAMEAPPDPQESTRCIAASRLAKAMRLGSDWQGAMDAAERALVHCREESNGHFIASLESEIGEILLQQGRLDEAEPWLERARQRQQDIGHRGGLLLTRLRLAELALGHDRDSDAEAWVDGIVDFFREARDWERKARAHRVLADIEEHRGNYEEAVEQLRRSSVALERFHARERTRRVAFLEARFDRDRQRRELALLEEQARASRLEQSSTDQQASLRLAVQSGGSLLIAALAWMLFRTTRQRRHFRALSRSDSLTGLLDHTAFFDTADEALQHSMQKRQGFVLVIADIDHFKRINDSHGHLAGDRVLRRISGLLRDLFPTPALLGRIGGEEFAIALQDCTTEQARSMIQAFQNRVRLAHSEDRAFRVTMSFGLAEFDGLESLEQLRRRTDAALYRAKQTGRDRLVVAE
ncbi:hypothetical protein WM2015_2540 [Wenzhouxiangella marina]|uniref:diguanylate cyclase n=2 Tax=Wenzhouxiangella marina TaxID=1579979 RepID=A0A0K0XYY2_9GAMM|nr:hypothetical protein WM2015_2540 [Wenzhouxiangella marina]